MSNNNIEFNPNDKKPQKGRELDINKEGSQLFFGEKERIFFDNLGKEIVNKVLRESFLLYQIDKQKTKTHAVYGESKQKVWKQPIQIYGLINVDVEDPSYLSEGGLVRKGFGKINADVYNSHLQEVGANPAIGDFMYYKGNYYEIIDDGSSNISNQHAWAGDKQFFITIKGVEINYDVFKAR